MTRATTSIRRKTASIPSISHQLRTLPSLFVLLVVFTSLLLPPHTYATPAASLDFLEGQWENLQKRGPFSEVPNEEAPGFGAGVGAGAQFAAGTEQGPKVPGQDGFVASVQGTESQETPAAGNADAPGAPGSPPPPSPTAAAGNREAPANNDTPPPPTSETDSGNDPAPSEPTPGSDESGTPDDSSRNEDGDISIDDSPVSTDDPTTDSEDNNDDDSGSSDPDDNDAFTDPVESAPRDCDTPNSAIPSDECGRASSGSTSYPSSLLMLPTSLILSALIAFAVS